MSEEQRPQEAPSKGKIGFAAILLITINSIMGTGIFFLPAVGAREAGLFSILSWAAMGLIAVYFSMIFAELVGIFPREGGVYEYAKEAFGRFPSFLLGWMTLIAANVTIAMLIVGAITYIGPVLPPYALIGASLFFVLIFNLMAFKGLKTGTTMLLAFAFITLITVFGLLIPGLGEFEISKFTGWMAHTGADGGLLGIAGLVFVTIFFIAETFFGWETSTFLAEKVNNPRKVMPKVMIIATVIIAVISFLFVISSFSLIPWQEFGQSITPLSDLAENVYGAGASNIYSILVYLAIIGSVAGWIVASPNLIVALAKDKLFITQMAQIHPKNETPYKAIIFQTVFTSILVIIGAGNYETLLHMLVPLVLILYAAVVISLLVIRRKYKDIKRPYIAPGGTVGPVLLMLLTLGLFVMWALKEHAALHTLGILFSFILFGVPIYLLLKFYYDSDATIRFQNETAYLSFFVERFFFPMRIQRRLLANAQVHGKTVLELGASSGLVSKAIHKRDPGHHIIVEHPGPLHRIIP
ncbi:APC family permease, partial [Candidatus Woesearchaeota archaeon]|nr:APC family permease [Candidatus Woesearchaeota archaeon]